MSALWAVPARSTSFTPVHVVQGVSSGVVVRSAPAPAVVPVQAQVQAQNLAPHIPVYAPVPGNPNDFYAVNDAMYAPLSADRIYSAQPYEGYGHYPAPQHWGDGLRDYDASADDPEQEHFQLGDEASNVHGSWRTPWEDNGEATEDPERQFLSLLESLEARVDLMSQMQETRAAIQQQHLRTSENNDPYDDPGPGPDVWDKVKDQHIYRLEEEVCGLRERLQSSLGSEAALAHADRVASVLQATSLEQTLTKQPQPQQPQQPQPEVVLPFCPKASGLNLEISEDGYTATRVRGCRQSVAVGTGPLPRQEHGRYFEVTVEDTVPGWVGGLGIGVTSSTPQGMKRIPDKAWRIPKTFVIGYWGCVFVDGCEQRTAWRADSLHPGARVGFLVTHGGDLIVFVDGGAAVRVDGAVPPHEFETNVEPLYPVVDVFAATRVVSMSLSARPPPPPWALLHAPISAVAMRKAAANSNGTEQRDDLR